MTTTYHVNGSCDCQAGAHGKDCKHSQAWKLYRYVERKLAAQTPPDHDDCHKVETCESHVIDVNKTQPLGEAPASVNVHLMIDGRDCLVTLRDHDEGRLLKRLQAVLEQYPPGQTAMQRGPTVSGQEWCSIHNVALKLNHGKDGRTWRSHKTTEGHWCKGRR